MCWAAPMPPLYIGGEGAAPPPRFPPFKDQLSQMLILGNHQAILKENYTSIIHRETSSNSASDVLLDPRYAFIIPLSNYDLIHKGRFRHQGGKKTLRNNVKVKLPKFLMEKRLTLL